MFLQSSKSIKSKILTAAMEVDQDYRQYRNVTANKVFPAQISLTESTKKIESK
jgi:hypothetical protein